jgi:hypothetical protein
MKIIKKSPFKLKYQSPLNNGEKDLVEIGGKDKKKIELDPVVLQPIKNKPRIKGPGGRPIYTAPDIGKQRPMSASEHEYFTNLNKLYPEFISSGGGRAKIPGYREETNEFDESILIPKSTSVEHVKALQKKAREGGNTLLYTKAMEELSNQEGYNIAQDPSYEGAGGWRDIFEDDYETQ